MLQKPLNRFIQRVGLWWVLQVTLGIGIVTAATVSILYMALPVHVRGEPAAVTADEDLVSGDELLERLQSPEATGNRLAKVMRPGLFKSATPLRDRPMADKTIERIRSLLKLQCIMQIRGEPVAYVNVQNSGLKKCRVGDSVEDLFTVLGIHEKSVDITIVDHRTTLSL